jgi:hypothetical protein
MLLSNISTFVSSVYNINLKSLFIPSSKSLSDTNHGPACVMIKFQAYKISVVYCNQSAKNYNNTES